MAYTDDWETLMNGVFGPGGRFKAAPGTPAEPRQQPNSTLNDLNAALLEQQKKLDAMLKAQSAQLKTQDTAAEAALADSRQMLRDRWGTGALPHHQLVYHGGGDDSKRHSRLLRQWTRSQAPAQLCLAGGAGAAEQSCRYENR